MCFSAKASFAASAVLATIGFASIIKNTKSRYFLLALVPMLFSLQQFMEGLYWLSAEKTLSPEVGYVSSWIYIIIARSVWPILVPLSLMICESQKERKENIKITLILGVLYSLILFIDLVVTGLQATVVENHILYSESDILHKNIPLVTKVIYGVIVLTPMFISSLRYMWMIGLLSLIAFIFTQYAYQVHFLSVWCFFAALISLLTYKVIVENQDLQ